MLIISCRKCEWYSIDPFRWQSTNHGYSSHISSHFGTCDLCQAPASLVDHEPQMGLLGIYNCFPGFSDRIPGGFRSLSLPKALFVVSHKLRPQHPEIRISIMNLNHQFNPFSTTTSAHWTPLTTINHRISPSSIINSTILNYRCFHQQGTKLLPFMKLGLPLVDAAAAVDGSGFSGIFTPAMPMMDAMGQVPGRSAGVLVGWKVLPMVHYFSIDWWLRDG